MKLHEYHLKLNWLGNTGSGTKSYTSYSRNYSIEINGKPTLFGSSDPSFLGDASKYNPEEMFLAAISSCHMLWYLHLCSDAGIVIEDYIDLPTGTMQENNDGSGYFTGVTLNPTVYINNGEQIEKAIELHKKANEFCFIANSLNFKVEHNPVVKIKTN